MKRGYSSGGVRLPEYLDGFDWLRHGHRDTACCRCLVLPIRGKDFDHEFPDSRPLNTFRLTPLCTKGLRGDLKVDARSRAKVKIRVGMFIGAAFRRDDHDLAADIAVYERSDACPSGPAATVPDQKGLVQAVDRLGERVVIGAADRAS